MIQASSLGTPESPLANVRALLRAGNIEEAEKAFVAFLEEEFGFTVINLRIDAGNSTALNSLRGTFDTVEGESLFFKLHQEDGEIKYKDTEYYKSEILVNNGFPIDLPLYKCSEVGRQIVIYPRVDQPTFHDACREIEKQGCPADEVEVFAEAYDRFQRILGYKNLETLHVAEAELSAEEIYHGLIYRRTVDQDGDIGLGGRIKQYYLGKNVALPDGTSLPFEEFAKLKWVVNGFSYDISLMEAFENARKLTNPEHHETYPAIVAHGDDHTANLWWRPEEPDGEKLRYFDPAFAGEHLPALQAPMKALFHVNFAHENWFYDPDDLDLSALDVRVEVRGDSIHVDHEWDLSPLRKRFLSSQITHVLKPLIAEMSRRGILPDDWEDIMRATLFCCPTLCKNMLPGLGHPNPLSPEASMLGFSIAISLAAPPQKGEDHISKIMTELRNAL